MSAPPSPGQQAWRGAASQIRHNLGLDQPVQVQLVNGMGPLARRSRRSLFLGKPVAEATFEGLRDHCRSPYALVLTLLLASSACSPPCGRTLVDQAAMIIRHDGISMRISWLG